jgi:hypothetical protein
MYEVWVHTPDYGERAAIIAEGGESWVFSRLVIPRKENQVTEAVLTMPYQTGVVELFPLDTRLEFYDDGRLEGETQWFVRVPPKLVYDEAGALVVEVRAECALYLLSGRIVAYPAGSSQAVKSGVADDVIKAIVRENLGALAPADRDLGGAFDVAADSSQGATVYKTMPRRNVLLVCQEIARASAQAGKPIFFDVVWTGSRLEFRTYLDARGADHRADSPAPIVLSPEFGTLANASRSFDHRDETTVVYCAGQGRGEQRIIVSVSDDARRTMTPFNRREVFVDARYLSLTESVATEADATLWRRRPIQQLGGTFEDTDTWRYGRDWSWGDLTAGEFNGEVLTVRVHAVTITVTPGARTIVGELRADSTEAEDAVRRIEGQLDAGAADELPVFSETPAAYYVPQAGAEGTIADGWLSDAIARLADLSWANISGKPSTFAPVAHVSAHQHGGTDEVATVTPAANAIPKASAGATIADGWLSSAIARLTDITTHAAVKDGVHGLANSGGYTLTIPATGTAALRASAATAGRVAFWSSSAEISHDSLLFWNATSKLLGVNNASPAYPLDVSGIIQTSSRVQVASASPGLWFDETDGAKGAFFGLDGGLFQIQRRATGFGAFEASPFILDINAPGSTIRIASTGAVGIGSAPSVTGAGDLDVFGLVNIADHIRLTEISAPAVPAANKGVIYLEDNGAGKTRLVVKFSSGAAQVIATQP